MRAVVCVLKSGKWHTGHNWVRYEPKHVRWLRDQVVKFSPIGTRFVCFSDINIDAIDTIPLEMNWPGWWSKMEMFRHDLGPVLYMDLDTVIVGPLDGLLSYPHDFTALQSLGKKSTRLLNSGLMAWNGCRADIYNPFAADYERWMLECRTNQCWGDQGFIARIIGDKWDSWQSLFPGAVGSYKNTWGRRKPPASARIVCFHGKPKPYEVKHDWVPPCLS
jgi:hypothetical protein